LTTTAGAEGLRTLSRFPGSSDSSRKPTKFAFFPPPSRQSDFATAGTLGGGGLKLFLDAAYELVSSSFFFFFFGRSSAEKRRWYERFFLVLIVTSVPSFSRIVPPSEEKQNFTPLFLLFPPRFREEKPFTAPNEIPQSTSHVTLLPPLPVLAAAI